MDSNLANSFFLNHFVVVFFGLVVAFLLLVRLISFESIAFSQFENSPFLYV